MNLRSASRGTKLSLGFPLRLAVGCVALAVVGCSTQGTAPWTKKLTSATVKIEFPPELDRQLQTVLAFNTYTITVHLDSSDNLSTQVGSASGNYVNNSLATIDLLPADVVLDFKVVLNHTTNGEVGLGLKQQTLVSQAAANAVPVTVYANGGDLTGGTLSGSVSQSSTTNSVVSARFKLLGGGAVYRITPTATGGGACGSPTFAVTSGVENALGTALQGTGTNNTAAFNVAVGSTGYYSVQSTVTGCGAGGTIGINALKIGSAQVVVD